MRGRLGYSGGVVAEAGASLNGEATGREALGGERAGEAWARTTELTGGPGLPEREWHEGERVESLTGGAGLSEEARAREAGPPGPGRGEGKRGRAELVGPDSAQPRGGFSFSFLFLISNSFLFLFLFLFLFVSFSFESKIL